MALGGGASSPLLLPQVPDATADVTGVVVGKEELATAEAESAAAKAADAEKVPRKCVCCAMM